MRYSVIAFVDIDDYFSGGDKVIYSSYDVEIAIMEAKLYDYYRVFVKDNKTGEYIFVCCEKDDYGYNLVNSNIRKTILRCLDTISKYLRCTGLLLFEEGNLSKVRLSNKRKDFLLDDLVSADNKLYSYFYNLFTALQEIHPLLNKVYYFPNGQEGELIVGYYIDKNNEAVFFVGNL